MKKKKKYLSIILVHDESKGPVSIRIRFLFLNILFVLFLLVASVVILAGRSYWKWTQIVLDYNYLKDRNQRLEESNIKINRIIKEFNEWKRNDERIKELLGMNMPISDRNSVREVQVDARVQPSLINQSSENINQIPYNIPSNYPEDFIKNSSFIPTTLPVKGYVTRRYMVGKDAGNRIHYGIDIVAKLNSVIQSAGSGFVIFANWTYEYGNEIIIDHCNGFMSFYKHNHRLLVSQGDFVKQGAPIALLGNSGISSAPHLHFEIWKNGKPINPEILIPNLK